MPGKPLKAGKLRQLIAIQSNAPAQDSFNESVPAYSTVATVWGSIEPRGGSRYWLGEELHDETTYLITIRYYPGLVPETFRLQWTDSQAKVWTFYLVNVSVPLEVPNQMALQVKTTV